MNKEYILQEIKRTAQANGGVPLGQRRVMAETGLKESDWFGIYWARWGDASREAGFSPNQLRGAYDTTDLLEKYAKLVLELGRLPTKGDLRLKARRDETFPSDRTFDRLGPKAQLITQLGEYCRSRDRYEDVVRLCAAYTSRHRDVPNDDKPGVVDIGFVYLVKSGRFYKIGKTNAVGRRGYELAIQLPERITRIHVIQTGDPSGIEAYWHKRFASKRKHGEWFELDAADITAFKRRKFM